MVHYNHRYDLIKNSDGTCDLALVDTYIWIHLCFSEEEIESYYSDIIKGLTLGNWTLEQGTLNSEDGYEIYSKGNLIYTITKMKLHPEDLKENRIIPKEYSILEIKLSTRQTILEDEVKNRPWEVLRSGIRKKDGRGNPHIINNVLDSLLEYFPAQVE